jgi:diguanylate cyclase (GGDEF)-like protein
MEETEYRALEHIKKLLRENRVPVLEGELAENPLLKDIHADLAAIREALFVFSEGDISHNVTARGIIPGCIKTIQAHLRHMIWQVQMVAQGDFSQQVQFMGEFSTAFNTMVRQMDITFKALKEKEAALVALTNSLRNEVDLKAAAAEALQASESRFKYLASHDPLTGAMNRRAFMERASVELKAAGLVERPCGFVMMDIDHFKIFNDTWGHQAGDEALRHVVQVMGSLLRKNDFLGRYGGEEFIFFFEGADRYTGTAIAERIRKAVESQPVALESGPVPITASFGVTVSDIHKSRDEGYVEALIHDADVALYEAKRSGRNRVVCFGAAEEVPAMEASAGIEAAPPEAPEPVLDLLR